VFHAVFYLPDGTVDPVAKFRLVDAGPGKAGDEEYFYFRTVPGWGLMGDERRIGQQCDGPSRRIAVNALHQSGAFYRRVSRRSLPRPPRRPPPRGSLEAFDPLL
jgi:hypothetical protein